MRIDASKLLVLVAGVVVVGVALYFFLPADWRWGSSEESSLRHVTILFRQGLSSPEKAYRNDPYIYEKELWPDGLGQLMLKGKEQMYTLGTFFREHYKSFIPKYSAKEVTVNSSEFDRVLMSAAMLLAGWFPPEEEQVWSEELLWQPIPIHSVPYTQDYTIAFGIMCPRYYSEWKNLEKEARGNWTEDDKREWDLLQRHMGEEKQLDYETVTRYYHTLNIEQDVGLQLPEWTKEVFPDKMAAISRALMHMLLENDYMKKANGGNLLKTVLDQMKEKIEGNEDKKLSLYAGHDLSILSLTATLGYDPGEFFYPEYGSSLMFELHQSKGVDFYVKVVTPCDRVSSTGLCCIVYQQSRVKLFYLNNSYSTEPLLLDVPVCPNPCSFAELYNATEYMRSFNPETDC